MAPGVLPDQLRRHSLFGTASTYRILEPQGPFVLVEVVAAPGLPPGMRLRLTTDVVHEMTLLPSLPDLGSVAESPPDRTAHAA